MGMFGLLGCRHVFTRAYSPILLPPSRVPRPSRPATAARSHAGRARHRLDPAGSRSRRDFRIPPLRAHNERRQHLSKRRPHRRAGLHRTDEKHGALRPALHQRKHGGRRQRGHVHASPDPTHLHRGLNDRGIIRSSDHLHCHYDSGPVHDRHRCIHLSGRGHRQREVDRREQHARQHH